MSAAFRRAVLLLLAAPMLLAWLAPGGVESNPLLPRGLINQTAAEAKYLDLHKCRNHGEAYSAAYLTSKEHLLTHKTDYNLTWVNCEMASFIMMSTPRAEKVADSPAHGGLVVQSLDVLDFSIVHLSAYERLLRRHMRGAKHSIAAVQEAARALKLRAKEAAARRNSTQPAPSEPQEHAQAQEQPPPSPSGVEGVEGGSHELHPSTVASMQRRTVAMMPFLGTDMGAGHSDLGNRYWYLQACVWSLKVHFDNIAVFVKSQEDHDYIMLRSGLPVTEVHVLEGLPKSAGLPVGSVQAAKRLLQSGQWDFDYLYYTESDQLLQARDWSALYGHLQHYRRRMLVPHRLMPYPQEVLHSVHHKPAAEMVHPAAAAVGQGANGGRDTAYAADEELLSHYKCCLPRQNCVERTSWVPLKDRSVPVVRMQGLPVPLGNTNFHLETFRACTMMRIPDSQPPAPTSVQQPNELFFVNDTAGGRFVCP